MSYIKSTMVTHHTRFVIRTSGGAVDVDSLDLVSVYKIGTTRILFLEIHCYLKTDSKNVLT